MRGVMQGFPPSDVVRAGAQIRKKGVIDMQYERQTGQMEQGCYEAFVLAARDWVPNNRKLAVAVYRAAIPVTSAR